MSKVTNNQLEGILASLMATGIVFIGYTLMIIAGMVV